MNDMIGVCDNFFRCIRVIAKSRLYSIGVGIQIGVFLLCLVLGGTAFAAKRYSSAPEGIQRIWHNGDRTEKVWMETDKIAVFWKSHTMQISAKDALAAISSFVPDAKIEMANSFIGFYGTSITRSGHEVKLLLRRLAESDSIRYASPVFYAGTRDPKNRMALTGEIIIHFKKHYTDEEISFWCKEHNVSLIKSFDFSEDTYLVDARTVSDLIEFAEEIYALDEVRYAYPNWFKVRELKQADPLYSDEWHLLNTGQGGCTSGEDANVAPVWSDYTGINITVAIVDDGLEIGHEDLAGNVVAGLSHDYVDGDSDPTGGDHGTCVGGVAAAVGWNDAGVRGTAPDAGLVGHRLLGAGTDTNEADALTRNMDAIDIYSNSWGPADVGELHWPGPLTEAALMSGIQNGRSGRGNIYTWAGGNGGDFESYGHDNSNYDGYANSRYTIAVAASTCQGEKAWYSEEGANILVNTPSNGGPLAITTTDRTGSLGYDPGNYTDSFGGTSSACPMGSGVVALMLDANPNLGWRDVQWILATTAEKNDPSDTDWATNGAGYHINHKYGFGRVDAVAAVNAAKIWSNLGQEVSTTHSSNPNIAIPDNYATGVSDSIYVGDDFTIQHVEVYLSVPDHLWAVTDLEIELIAPSGTSSLLAEKHQVESTGGPYDSWRFTSVRHLGESPKGTWTLRIKDLWADYVGTFESWTLKIYGYSGSQHPPIIIGQTTIDHDWKTVNLSCTLQNAVYILSPPTSHGTDPGVVRLQNVTNNSFDIRFQEWLYKDGAHTQENIPYLVISGGWHQMANGSIWEAGTFSLSGTGAWTSHAFTSAFPSTPALFLTAQTYNGSDPITVRARNVTNTGFEAALFEEEALMDGHVTEEIGYLAVYSPQLSGTVNINGTDVPYLLQAQSVDHRFVPVLSSDIKLEEEQSKDSEVNHIDETISILALGDKIFTQDISSNGGDTASIRRLAPEYNAAMEWGTVDGVDHNWMKIPLAKEYLNPVVAVRPVSSCGGDPGVIRIRNVSHNSFELCYNEWAYKDGGHTQERVFYLVAEAGIRSVAGLTVEAEKLNSSKLLADGWEPITFSAFFSHTPSVFTSVQTYNGADPVTTRLSNCTFAGFYLTMDEEEAKNDGHTTETIGWIAIEKGTGKTNDNRSVVVLSGSTNHIPTQINFGQSMARRFPVVVSDMVSTYGGDPGFLRYQNLGPSSIDLFIQEEASLDTEMNHTTEDVSLFVAE